VKKVRELVNAAYGVKHDGLKQKAVLTGALLWLRGRRSAGNLGGSEIKANRLEQT